MAQTKKGSLLESIANTAIGFCINYCINFFVFGSCGIHLSPGKNFLITGVFTIVSITRGYLIRRFVEYKHSAKSINNTIEYGKVNFNSDGFALD